MEKPTLPKGTRDFGPAVMAKRNFILNTIRTVFQKYGFQPLETPAMENLSTLTGKYGDEGDQLLFKILNSGDYLNKADEKVLVAKDSKKLTSSISEKGLRYDLTVPFARFVVMNRNEISFPFKRYQIQPVWRADRPQKGRYREFYQCDADVVGTKSLICEAEIILMIKEVMTGLNLSDYTIKINHRGVLMGLAETLNAKGKETDLFVAIDKLDKAGKEKVKEELITKGFSADQVDQLYEFLKPKNSNTETLGFLTNTFSTSLEGQKGKDDLNEVFSLLKNYNANDDHVELDLSLARGLSYYTGCIFEVKINNVGIGSVSGGGRYDNLTGNFGLPDVSGVGFSFGVDRLYDALEELNNFPKEATITSTLLICHFDEASLNYGLGVLAKVRNAGISSEIYPDKTKIKKQLDFGNKKQIPFTVIIGTEEMNSGNLVLKNMETGEQETLTLDKLITKLR